MYFSINTATKKYNLLLVVQLDLQLSDYGILHHKLSRFTIRTVFLYANRKYFEILKKQVDT